MTIRMRGTVILLLALAATSGCAQDADPPRRPLNAEAIRGKQHAGPPSSYDAREVTYRTDVDGSILAGTLTIPQDARDCPAVLLLSGSGLQDRDETSYGHQPFKVLADHLTRRGIVVLRVDDRGVGGSTGSPWGANPEVMARDALAGVRFLKKQEEVDGRRIGLLGHSEGALVAAIAAAKARYIEAANRSPDRADAAETSAAAEAQTPDVAFIVMLAGLGLPWPENKVLADEMGLARLGKSPAVIAANRDLLERIFEVVRQGHGVERTEAELRRAIAGWRGSLDDEAKTEFDTYTREHPGVWGALANQFAEPPYHWHMTADPRSYLERVACPVLALCGERDVQVPAEPNLAAIRAGLRAGGNTRSEVRALPELNHLFQHAETGSVSEYGEIEETFAPEALELIADWILQHAP